MATEQGKIVVDPIYGTIELDALAVKIIDTDCFQRLRYIKQLSFADFVYPGATHTRFVHSIGVYYLACEMIKTIDAQGLEPELKLKEHEKTCIRVAALCHDLGHGPFSHGYERIFEDVTGLKLKHETISQILVKRILKEILEENTGFKKFFPEYDIPKCIQLIQYLIEGGVDKDSEEKLVKKKKYMFQIVSNKDSGVDVDKWDYFNRDARACGVPETFQYDRALKMARVVITKDGNYELGYREADAFGLYNMFNTRFTMYRNVYCHRVADAVGLMIKDIFQLVKNVNDDPKNPFDKSPYVDSVKIDLFPIKIGDGRTLLKDGNYLALEADDSIPEESENLCLVLDKRYLNIDEYLKLRDDVLLRIGDSNVPQYREARDLIKRLRERKLYKLVHEVKVSSSTTETQMEHEIQEKLEKFRNMKRDVEVINRTFNYGLKDKDPVTKIYFYNKMATKEINFDGTLSGTHIEEEVNSGQDHDASDENATKKADLEGKLLERDNEEEVNSGQDHDASDENATKKADLEGKLLERDNVSYVLPSVFEEHYIRFYEKFSGKGTEEQLQMPMIIKENEEENDQQSESR